VTREAQARLVQIAQDLRADRADLNVRPERRVKAEKDARAVMGADLSVALPILHAAVNRA
jgi:hypothetical protein